jgi:hypothetical protein
MVIGLLSLEIYIPYAHSLKEKRQRLNKIKDRVKKRYNIAFAELDFQDKWQRSKIGIVTLNNHKSVIEKMFQKIMQDVEENIDGEITQSQIEYI